MVSHVLPTVTHKLAKAPTLLEFLQCKQIDVYHVHVRGVYMYLVVSCITQTHSLRSKDIFIVNHRSVLNSHQQSFQMNSTLVSTLCYKPGVNLSRLTCVLLCNHFENYIQTFCLKQIIIRSFIQRNSLHIKVDPHSSIAFSWLSFFFLSFMHHGVVIVKNWNRFGTKLVLR